MRKNTEYQHHIKLIVNEKLPADEAQHFYMVVKETGPDTIVKPIEVYDEINNTKKVHMKIKKTNREFWYIVALYRDLTAKEAEKIVMVWTQQFEGDFLIETSTPYTGEDDECVICDEEITEDYYQTNQDIRNFHGTWMTSLLEDGWRLGPRYSIKEKTHPLLLPWEQIPRSFKESAYSGILLKLMEK